ncbi:Acyl_transf_3 domain-containing protein [Meloidogyne graminicola]|uniref:Acyl_transf_3 domain-containing protein n=1 Tax=Meloidogyne graminicola TaxID=189291 RepID=A0A8S9ZPP4_9BILA|nr:Acyl_transf_3 domain-containing protein [Meloidogyne graminicola]
MFKIILINYFLLFIYYLIISVNSTNLTHFSEKQIWSFLRSIPRHKLLPQCGLSLDKIERFLTDLRTLEEQRFFFSESFSIGDDQQFISRDQDRWLYNAFMCIKAAGESSYSASEYPLHYCYGNDIPFNKELHKISYGMCIPSTCSDENDRLKLLIEWQKLANPYKNYSINSSIEFGDCTKSRHEKQWWEQSIPLLHFGSDLILIAIVGIATAIHYQRGEEYPQIKCLEENGKIKNEKQKLLLELILCFSAKKNFQKLVQMPKEKISTITCFFGLRFGAMCWTLIGHSFIFVQAFLINVDDLKDELVDHFWNQWITNFTLSVDVFFVLSGTLTSYSWFRKWKGEGIIEIPNWTSFGYWLRFYRHRIFRLWPAYIFTLIAVTVRVSITHYHPMWPPTDPAVQCPKHWIENVLFINSLTDNRCMPWTWYIGTEFLFYLISPIFLLSILQSPKAGILLCISICCLSSLLNVITMLKYNFPPTQMLWKQPNIFSPDFILHHLVIYIKPWYRIGPYIVGIVLGYILAQHSLTSHNRSSTTTTLYFSHSRSFVCSGWLLAIFGCLWSIFGLYPALQGWNWVFYNLFYGAVSRTIFAIALGWVIYACHTGIGGPLNYMLSLGLFLPLSNLSYSAYLFHMIPVVFTYVVSPFPMHFDSKAQILGHCFVQLIIAYAYGVLCSLLAELPALNIERIFLGNSLSSIKTTNKSIKNKNNTINGHKSNTTDIEEKRSISTTTTAAASSPIVSAFVNTEEGTATIKIVPKEIDKFGTKEEKKNKLSKK